MNLEDINAQQGVILETLQKESVSEPRSFRLLDEVLNYDENLLEELLGDFGHRLRAFAYSVNREHSEITHSSQGLLNELLEGDFAETLREILQLAKYAKEQGMKHSIPVLVKAINYKISKELKIIDNPHKNNQFIRLLRSKEHRDFLRISKNIRPVDLQSFYKKANWGSYANNFKIYSRFNTDYEKEINKAQIQADRYKSLGCLELANGIQESIEDFRSGIQDIYQGFHRITMTNSAIVLAKLHGYNFTRLEGVPIQISKEFLENYIGITDQVTYNYQPRAYPYHELQHLAPSKVIQMVDYLEAMPGLNGSAFDHYVVLVPGIDHPNQNLFLMDTEGVKEFKDKESLEKELDLMLIQDKTVIPILLGEKDGKCYFICYWI